MNVVVISKTTTKCCIFTYWLRVDFIQNIILFEICSATAKTTTTTIKNNGYSQYKHNLKNKKYLCYIGIYTYIRIYANIHVN